MRPRVYLGYNTNGLAFHNPIEAIELLAEIGYSAVAITVDHDWLNPYSPDCSHQLEEFRSELQLYRMRSVIETGARFLLNPRAKHEPTLISDDPAERRRRIEFLKHCIDIAKELGSDCVSLWSGKQPATVDLQTGMDRLAESLQPVIRHADDQGVTLGFEPEPGMMIDTMNAYARLLEWIESPCFQLTLDIGHLFCQGEVPIVDFISRWAERIVNVHIEDMRAGVHEHLMFGEGQIYFPPVINALHDIDYQGGVFVELSRHSHDAPNVARRSFEFLAPLVTNRTSTNM